MSITFLFLLFHSIFHKSMLLFTSCLYILLPHLICYILEFPFSITKIYFVYNVWYVTFDSPLIHSLFLIASLCLIYCILLLVSLFNKISLICCKIIFPTLLLLDLIANPLNQLLEAENQVSRQIQQAEASMLSY